VTTTHDIELVYRWLTAPGREPATFDEICATAGPELGLSTARLQAALQWAPMHARAQRDGLCFVPAVPGNGFRLCVTSDPEMVAPAALHAWLVLAGVQAWAAGLMRFRAADDPHFRDAIESLTRIEEEAVLITERWW